MPPSCIHTFPMRHKNSAKGNNIVSYPDDTDVAVVMALQSEYKDVNVDNAKKLLEMTNLV